MRDSDRRAHLRYRDPESTTVCLLVTAGEAEEAITGLMVNESRGGLACVYVGPAIELNSQVVWQETETIRTCCNVVRCQNLYADVFLLALQFVG